MTHTMGINPHENAINRLVSTRKWSVENSAKWITDEHEEMILRLHLKKPRRKQRINI